MSDKADVGISDGTQTLSLFADCDSPPTVQSALPSAANHVKGAVTELLSALAL